MSKKIGLTSVLNRPTFTIILILSAVVFAIDASVSQVADFLIQQTTSIYGIAIFGTFVGVLILVSYVLLRFIWNTTSEITTNSFQLRLIYSITFATQLAMIVTLLIVLSQIVLLLEYNTVVLAFASGIGLFSASAVTFISFLTLVSWYRVNRSSYVVLIFSVVFAINVYLNCYVAVEEVSSLVEKDQLITPDSEVVYASDTYQPGTTESNLKEIFDYLAVGTFALLVVGSGTLLHHYAGRIGRVKFWLLLSLPMIYYLSILADTLGLYVPESDSEFFNYYLYVSLTGVIGGALLGYVFWRISETLSPNKSASSYLKLCSFGFVFLSIAEVGSVVAASFPPFGFASFSMLTLSSAMVIMGLYSTAISISQDIRLRQYIKDLTKADSGFLSNIGKAQLEKQVQAKASDLENVVKEQRLEIEKKSGIQSSVQAQDIRQYLLEVLQEVDKHKSTK